MKVRADWIWSHLVSAVTRSINFYFSHLSKGIKIKMNRTIKFPVLHGRETWSNILREEHRLQGVCKLGAGEDIWAWKERKWQAAGENCGASWFLLLTIYYFGGWDGCGMWHIWGRSEMCTRFRWGNLTGRDHLEELCVGGRIILELS